MFVLTILKRNIIEKVEIFKFQQDAFDYCEYLTKDKSFIFDKKMDGFVFLEDDIFIFIAKRRVNKINDSKSYSYFEDLMSGKSCY